MLAGSGKLGEMIERPRPRSHALRSRCSSTSCWRAYSSRAGNKEKVKEVMERMARLGTGRRRLTFQLAQQLYQSGEFATAITYYRAALEKEPALFANRLSEVINAYMQANRTAELVPLFEKIDLKSMGSSSSVLNVINILSITQPGQHERTCHGALPQSLEGVSERAATMMLSRLSRDEFWTLPEVSGLRA